MKKHYEKIIQAIGVKKAPLRIEAAVSKADYVSGSHRFTAGNYGSETASERGFTLSFTDYTEFNHTFWIRVGKHEVF